MFKALFQRILSNQDEWIKEIYNNGVIALAEGDLEKAISLFEQVCEQHPSAAYNLGLIYLDGVGQITPKFYLARKYFQLADKLNHPKAKISSKIIGLNHNQKLTPQQQIEFFKLAVSQYVEGGQFGNLAYLIAYDIKRNILETSSNQMYSLDRFLSYELYCMRNYGNAEVISLYKTSSLTNLPINYLEDWENGETAVISDYLNENVWRYIIIQSNNQLKFDQMGALRVSIVNAVYEFDIE